MKFFNNSKEYDKVKNILITKNMQKKKEWLKEYMRIQKEICFHYVLSAQDIKTDKSEFLSPIFPIQNFQERILFFSMANVGI
ncbi:hypothetical protein LEP1GSC079_5022 [Leptospira interrogans str. FPW1039]|uniref:Uncharacterized protein n=1 Tax=Leptospira interrogans str. FPW1039 TaxID=1193040 RepID=A0A0F6I8W8_LEPIR|nr:hypothetical protein LEP1GSC096_1063 [Leptospira interrogans serovar Hebdomadis str. R499]EKR84627.1 hypothetical protein LEP1GSC099_3919 [Leptospira interrogans str. UI 08452]EMJ34493.1 hypothetical protein LEP1GSC079_5022 [Leptospira interrogans str. FPW1039]EMN33831.1 hypothetical protein LEP1GSC084_1579 [Leptospira interrogans serovar Medanensis str. L0448]EMN42010.1 hypothetical protein LEP1GSC085_0688 [Leptospira interrogans str. L0996]EMN95879.1 hypothetical protein LEP1GSC110_0832 [